MLSGAPTTPRLFPQCQKHLKQAASDNTMGYSPFNQGNFSEAEIIVSALEYLQSNPLESPIAMIAGYSPISGATFVL